MNERRCEFCKHWSLDLKGEVQHYEHGAPVALVAEHECKQPSSLLVGLPMYVPLPSGGYRFAHMTTGNQSCKNFEPTLASVEPT